MTEKELAKAIGVSPETINGIISEEERITADMALRLGRFTKTTPEMWLNLQAAVDLWDACHSPPNKTTMRAMEEARQGKGEKYDSVDKMFAEHLRELCVIYADCV